MGPDFDSRSDEANREGFAVLEHRWGGVHWDVMLERNGALRTWAVDSPIAPGLSQAARPLPDHRLAYLDYEGPISGDRGEVRRVASGTYEAAEWADDRIVVQLSGPQLNGGLILARDEGGAWSLVFAPGKVD